MREAKQRRMNGLAGHPEPLQYPVGKGVRHRHNDIVQSLAGHSVAVGAVGMVGRRSC